MRRFRRLAATLAVLGAAWLWWRDSSGPGELAYRGTVAARTFTANGPPVLIDDAHWNAATGTNGLVAFAGLLAADGYVVLPGANATRAETLIDARIAVIANPLALSGLARRAADRVNLAHLAMFDDEALSTQEIETTIQWIENGGSLLLAVDEDPIARGSVDLARRLGVELRRRLVIDLGHSEPRFPERLVFSRENGLADRKSVV